MGDGRVGVEQGRDRSDVDLASRIAIIPTILETVCQTTGMGFAAVARVTDKRWIACGVRDTIDFGLEPGGELELGTTLCDEIRRSGDPVIISDAFGDPVFGTHRTPAQYGFRSYISYPIILPDGSFFGTLCAIDPEPRDLARPEIRSMFAMFAKLIGFTLDQARRLGDSQADVAAQQEAAELREQFIAVMGHDLRNPLAAIQAGITLLENQPSPERAALLLAQMRRSTDRMTGLIADVLDLARGQLGGGIALRRTLVPIEPIIDQVVTELASTHPDHVISAECSTDQQVHCDADRIAQLLSNLIGNALTHGTSAQPVRVLCSSQDGVFTLSVANGGQPIPPAAMEQLFQPFVRGKAASDREGLGLGLYIAAKIAAAHDGHLSVASTTEETRFSLQMPLV
ncbi:GAF domain-containing sensor histidine kinase [Sphingomonas ginsenosidivorax]|uniref:histidine kinase n=1 Tax=Sphingomonas ginsenosidivorax TaxID=862135 RepID=A0A5C6UHX3_9SPHN|nr:GAF domain-containing sensor histidine kinase [Sphingomonas ginsenosidivorax]TXC71665.1 GAF domain-containing sensor histidine kinase [Sphingomonas ginsenosidivorax]